MKLAALPRPSTARAATRAAPELAAACSSAPTTAIALNAARPCGAQPMRSNIMPTGIWATPSAMKNAPLASPSSSGESPRSRISSGAMTPPEARKNWLKLVTAASIAIRVARALVSLARVAPALMSPGIPTPFADAWSSGAGFRRGRILRARRGPAHLRYESPDGRPSRFRLGMHEAGRRHERAAAAPARLAGAPPGGAAAGGRARRSRACSRS